MKLPFSAIVVGLNEAHLIQESLSKILFCDEILYFDLGSTDNSVEVAKSFGAKVIIHEKVDSCEWIHAKFAKTTKHKWLIIIDPDEVLSDELINGLNNMFNKGAFEKDDVGAFTAPWIFFFKSKQLMGTHWGGISKRIFLVNTEKFEFRPLIHLGRKIKDTFKIIDIPFNGRNSISHFWVASYKQLFEKHLRYLRNEGKARYENGHRVLLKKIPVEILRAFKNSFYSSKGYLDGFTGLFLSAFWAWYEGNAQFNTYKYQLKMKKQLGDKS